MRLASILLVHCKRHTGLETTFKSYENYCSCARRGKYVIMGCDCVCLCVCLCLGTVFCFVSHCFVKYAAWVIYFHTYGNNRQQFGLIMCWCAREREKVYVHACVCVFSRKFFEFCISISYSFGCTY